MLSHLWVTLNLMKIPLKSHKRECEFWIGLRKKSNLCAKRSFACSALTFRDNKHRNVGDVTKICFDGLLWTWNFDENVLRHGKEMYFRHETDRICTRY